MITLHCCGQDYYADEVHIGRKIKCVKCGRLLLIGRPVPAPQGKVPETFTAVRPEYPNFRSKHRYRYAVSALAVFLLIVGLLFYRNYSSPSARSPAKAGASAPGAHPPASPTGRSLTRTSAPMPIATNPEEAREREILEQNAGKLGDPELGKEYQDINERHFGNRLPKIPVIWEPRLKEIGPLIAKDFTLEGITRLFGDKLFILLNPDLRLDRRRLKSALCHEMVHVHLFSVGDTGTKHGPAFQSILHRLSAEGAFEGKWVSESEKLGLRSWLERESGRLDVESSEFGKIRDSLEREGEDLDKAVNELNARISTANEQGFGWPSEAEIESIKSRRDLFKQRAIDFNSQVERHNADRTRFNREANRYNLIMSYPDGLDEESLVRPKSSTGGYALPD